MTIREILFALRRRWYVVVVTMLAGALLLMLFVRDGGVYTTKTVVTFLLPSATSLSLSNGSNDTSIITFARAVAADVNDGETSVSYSTDDAPYYGAGIRQGVEISVPSDGNQWYASYTRAEIDVKVVGRTKEWVAQQQSRIVERILESAQAQQAAVHADSTDAISVAVVPLTLDITKVTSSRTAQLLALGAMLLAIMIVSSWGAVTLDRRRARRRRSDEPIVAIQGGATT